MSSPLVSISCITFNHGSYIKECLDGFLMQETTFEFEILIHDDASTDNTVDIIKSYQERYPNLIKPIFQKENQYSKGLRGINNEFNFPRAKGKYIALCEGDDYWIDPYKLQKQVTILEKNPEIKICSHPAKRRYADLTKRDNYGYWGEESKIITAQQVIKNYAATAPFQSIMFKNENTEKLGIIIKQLIGGHSTLQIFYALPAGLYYLPDYMSVYRVESSSSISKILFKNDTTYLDRQIKNWKGLDLLNEYSNFQFDTEFQKSKRARALFAIRTGHLRARETFNLFKSYNLYREPIPLIKGLKIQIHTYLGGVKNSVLTFYKNNLKISTRK